MSSPGLFERALTEDDVIPRQGNAARQTARFDAEDERHKINCKMIVESQVDKAAGCHGYRFGYPCCHARIARLRKAVTVALILCHFNLRSRRLPSYRPNHRLRVRRLPGSPAKTATGPIRGVCP